jgi:hypothetical protein
MFASQSQSAEENFGMAAVDGCAAAVTTQPTTNIATDIISFILLLVRTSQPIGNEKEKDYCKLCRPKYTLRTNAGSVSQIDSIFHSTNAPSEIFKGWKLELIFTSG